MKQSVLRDSVRRVASWSSQRHVKRNAEWEPGQKVTLLESHCREKRSGACQESEWSLGTSEIEKRAWGTGGPGVGMCEKAGRVAGTQVLWDRCPNGMVWHTRVSLGNWGPLLGFLVLLIKEFRNGFKRKCLLDRIDPGDEISEDDWASPGSELLFHRSNWRKLVSPSEWRLFPHGTWGQGVHRTEKGNLWGWGLSSSVPLQLQVAVGLVCWADQNFPQVFAVTSSFLTRGFSVRLRSLGP